MGILQARMRKNERETENVEQRTVLLNCCSHHEYQRLLFINQIIRISKRFLILFLRHVLCFWCFWQCVWCSVCFSARLSNDFPSTLRIITARVDSGNPIIWPHLSTSSHVHMLTSPAHVMCEYRGTLNDIHVAPGRCSVARAAAPDSNEMQ